MKQKRRYAKVAGSPASRALGNKERDLSPNLKGMWVGETLGLSWLEPSLPTIHLHPTPYTHTVLRPRDPPLPLRAGKKELAKCAGWGRMCRNKGVSPAPAREVQGDDSGTVTSEKSLKKSPPGLSLGLQNPRRRGERGPKSIKRHRVWEPPPPRFKLQSHHQVLWAV